jgi:hypothetical protein
MPPVRSRFHPMKLIRPSQRSLPHEVEAILRSDARQIAISCQVSEGWSRRPIRYGVEAGKKTEVGSRANPVGPIIRIGIIRTHNVHYFHVIILTRELRIVREAQAGMSAMNGDGVAGPRR